MTEWDIPTWINVVTAVITAAAGIAAATPTAKDDEYVSEARRYWNQVRKVIDVLGLNVGNAKNRDGD